MSMTFYILLQVCNNHCARLHEFTFTHLVNLLVFFYRATRCVSAIFAVVHCPSILLSVTFVCCIQTAEDIIKLLSRPGSHIILFC